LKKRITINTLILMPLFCLTACAVNPVTLEKEFMIISEEKEISIGKGADPFIVQQFGYYDDPALQDYINRVGQKLVKVCPRRDIEYYFKILDSDDINAFALPGGYIYVTRGILAIAGMAAGPTTRELTVAGNLLFNSIILGYGREKEFLADFQGVDYMYKAGYNPLEMCKFQHTLSYISQGPAGYAQYLSTHPDIFDRIKRTEAQAKVLYAMQHALSRENKNGKDQQESAKVLADEYKSHLDGLAYGPRDCIRRIRIYEVKKGDTLESIAAREMGDDKKAREIAFLNGLEIGVQLYTGQKLKVVY